MFCGICGHEIKKPNAKFCTRCGTKLEVFEFDDASPNETQMVEAPAAPTDNLQTELAPDMPSDNLQAELTPDMPSDNLQTELTPDMPSDNLQDKLTPDMPTDTLQDDLTPALAYPIAPKALRFPIFDHVLEVPENLDAFNTYRLAFRKLANQAANDLAAEYHATIHNLDDFLASFPSLYNAHLDPLIKEAVNILNP